MTQIGTLQSVWRYPVKGMRGEELTEGFLGFPGVYGDRVFAFRSPGAPAGFPYHTAREHEDLLTFQPRFRDTAAMLRPPNLAEAEAMAPGISPVYPERDAYAVDVTGPDGRVMPIDDPALLEAARDSREDGAPVHLAASERPMTDCRPVSLFALATAQTLSAELGRAIDKRRFRANLYLDLSGTPGFAEEAHVGRSLRIGAKAVVAVVERDPRCKMIGLDPDTGDHDPKILRHVTEAHGGMAGLYGVVMVEGVVRPGDPVVLI